MSIHYPKLKVSSFVTIGPEASSMYFTGDMRWRMAAAKAFFCLLLLISKRPLVVMKAIGTVRIYGWWEVSDDGSLVWV